MLGKTAGPREATSRLGEEERRQAARLANGFTLLLALTAALIVLGSATRARDDQFESRRVPSSLSSAYC